MNSRIILALIVLGGALFSLGMAVAELINDHKLENSGVEIISEPISEYSKQSQGGSTISYHIRATFKVGQRTYACPGKIDKNMLEKLDSNPTVTVIYLAESPKICRVQGAEKGVEYWIFLIGSIVGIIGSVGYIYNFYTATRA